MSPHFTSRTHFRAAIVVWCVAFTAGCASWQGPRIDPSGERILIWPNEVPPAAVAGPPGATFVPPPPPIVAPPIGNVQAPPVYSDPPAPPVAGPAVIPPIITTPPAPSTTYPAAPAMPALPPPPTTLLPPAPPTAPPVVPVAGAVVGGIVPVGRDHLRLTPAHVVAPVGSEVVLKAGICGADGYLIASRRVDWYLDPRGAGQFGDAGTPSAANFLSWWEGPRRIDNWRAVGSTANMPVTLRRGTPDPRDDVPIVRGDAWITLTSFNEGTSVVTAYTPVLSEWNRATATIHWVDPQRMSAPTPIANAPLPVASAPATTPLPPVPPPQPVPKVQPQPVSPEAAAPASPAPEAERDAAPMPSRPQLDLELRRTGPEQVGVGAFTSFELIVTNTGSATAKEIEIQDRFDRGLRHPRAAENEFAVKYSNMRDLPPGESASIPLTFEVIAAGTQCHEVTVTAEGAAAVTERACITAQQAALEVSVTAPRTRVVGENAEFNVVVKNTGDVAAQNVELVIRFDPALDPSAINEPGHKRLPDGAIVLGIERLEAGERRPFQMTGRCISASERATARAVVTADGGVTAAAEGRVEILPQAEKSGL